MQYKHYVGVIAEFDPEGCMLPRSVRWDDGRLFPVDRILDIRPAASLKAGGAGIRYTCRILGQVRYLFLEDGRWFVEACRS